MIAGPRIVLCYVDGIPAPQGSKRHVGHGVLLESSKTLPAWRRHVKTTLAEAMDGPPFDAPVLVSLTFLMPRPAAHHRGGRRGNVLRPDAPKLPTTRPDLDKLIRAVLDAATGVVWVDDSRVVDISARKRYVDAAAVQQPGVQIGAWRAVTA